MTNKATTIKEQFGISVPKGSLYYPAAGDDMLNALMYSIDSVNEAHFSGRRQLVLPYPECGVKYLNSNRLRTEGIELGRKNHGTISKDVVIKAREAHNDDHIYISCFNNTLKKYFNFDAGVIRPDFFRQTSEIWTLNNSEGTATDVQIHIHKMDAVLMLMGLENISIFFYRRDSDGDGGSEQYWFSPALFNLVLYKMVDGGLIVTDGSNMSPYSYRKDFPWSSFKHHERIIKNFYYNNMRFEHIGKLESDDISDDTHIWQIHRE